MLVAICFKWWNAVANALHVTPTGHATATAVVAEMCILFGSKCSCMLTGCK
jgi:hypothetical protein